MPGASYGYYIWEDENGINVFWSVDRKDTSFSGTIAVDYERIELDLLINGGHDLSRVNVGAFLNNPSVSPFIIEKGYFDDIGSIPWYEKHPFSGFFFKLFANKYFTFIYLFINGIVIIEIIRITAFSSRKRKVLYTGISYIALIAIEILIYFVLRFFVI